MHLLLLFLSAVVLETIQPTVNPFRAAGISDPETVYAFLTDLQSAVAADDAGNVAALATFPVEVSIKKVRHRVRTSAEFQKLYPQIFDACLRRVVAATTRDDLSASWRGVMLGRGAVWFGQQEGGVIRLFAINGPIEGEPLCQDR